MVFTDRRDNENQDEIALGSGVSHLKRIFLALSLI